jgi:hypothetical protein
MNEHTPTPWYWDGQRYIREESTDAPLARMQDDDGHINPRERKSLPADANAAHVLKCVNLHDELVAALERMVAAYGGVTDMVSRDGERYQSDGAECAELAARAAIAKAKGAA